MIGNAHSRHSVFEADGRVICRDFETRGILKSLFAFVPPNYSSGELMNISIILAHVNPVSFNHAIANRAAETAHSAGN